MNKNDIRQYTVAVSYFRNLLIACDACGLNAAEIREKTGLTNIDRLTPEDRLGVEFLGRIWRVIDEVSGDPLIGLRIGTVARVGMLGILEFLLMSCDTIGDTLEQIVRYWRLVSDEDKTYDLKTADGCAHFQITSIIAHHHATFESVMLYMKHFAENMLGVIFDPTKTRIHFTHPLPIGATRQDFETAFCCSVDFDQDVNAMIFDAKELSQKLAHSDNLVHPLLRDKADVQLRALDANTRISQRVLFLVESGSTELGKIAQVLGLSVRSLQRKLRNENQSFRDVLDGFRKSKASRLFEEGWLSTGEIAFSLGYQEERAFFEACKRWYGMTPSRYRSHIKSVSA